MARRGISAALASLLLVGQLLFAVTSNALPRDDGSARCPCCSEEAGMSHDSHAGDPDCTTSGSPGETTHDCGRGCQLHAAGRCSFGVVPGASNTALTAQVKRLDASWLGDLLARVPEPPLFDFLRPPN